MFVGISPEKSDLDDTDIPLSSFPSSSYLKLVNAPKKLIIVSFNMDGILSINPFSKGFLCRL